MSCFQTLREKGYRLTPQRVAILETLHETKGHITAEEIYDCSRARCPRINKCTVYRTLELLKKLNLVAETDLGGDRLCYHHIESGHHHHLVCQQCGKVFDVDEGVLAPLEELLVSKYGFIANIRHLAIFGHCLDCQGRTTRAIHPSA